jgi:hypothetical protein
MESDHANSRLLLLLPLLIVFSTYGCAGDLVCRHHALELASYGVEKRLETRISIYKVNDLMWDAHAQAQVKVDGKWKWMTDWFGYVAIEDEPTFKPTGYMVFLSIPEYLEVLKKGSYSTMAGNRK